MLICPDQNIVFVHIPKCAGTSLRRIIAECTPGHIAMEGVKEHPELGMLNYFHVGIDRLKVYFPQNYEALQAHHSYAVVRNPLERFGSSVRQFLVETEGEAGRMAGLDPKIVREKVSGLLGTLSQELALDAPSQPFTVFAKQTDFVFDAEGVSYVDTLVPVDMVPDLIDHFGRVTGVQLDRDYRSNQNVSLRREWLVPIAYRVNHLVWKTLPVNAHSKIKSFALKFLAEGTNAAQASGILEMPEVKDFVAKHYARDIQLYEETVAQRDQIKAQLAAHPTT